MLNPKTDIPDRAGRYPLRFPKSARISDIREYLFHTYPDYQFCIYFRFTEEYDELEEIDVYFVDEILGEIATFMGKDDAIKRIKEEAS